MIATIAALWLAALGCAGSYDRAPVHTYRRPDGVVEGAYFYDALSPYGRWIDYAPYGWCWTPYEVASDWRPYSDGYWVYTDYGWSWATYEPWGWATYHYGRWLFDSTYGWVWVPGSVWGPAWVAWRASDDWVGWAPLSPAASWSVSFGLKLANVAPVPAPRWSFVPRRYLADSNLRLRITSVARNPTLLTRTHDVTRFASRDGRPVNQGVDIVTVERAIGRNVPRLHIDDADSPLQGRAQVSSRGTIAFFRPRIHVTRGTEPRSVVTRRGNVETIETHQQEERQRLEGSLALERERLLREREQEQRSPGDADAMRRRHQAEDQAFEHHAREQREVLEQRLKKRIMSYGQARNVVAQEQRANHKHGGNPDEAE